MIYTSYFSNWRKLQKNNITIVSIARFDPKGCNYPRLKYLSPDINLLNLIKSGNINWEEYTEMYKSQIQKYNLDEIKHNLSQLQEAYKDIALCCYESPSKNCHRHVLSRYLNQKLNLNIKEFI